MRISKIKIEEVQTKAVNLKEINLTKKPLGSIVALVGQNGAGKTRLLNFVQEYASTLTPEKLYEEHLTLIPSRILNPFDKNIKSTGNLYSTKKNQIENSPNTITLETQINQLFNPIKNNYYAFGSAYIKKIDNDELQKIKSGFNNGKIDFNVLLTNKHLEDVFQSPNTNAAINEINDFNNNSTIDYLKQLSVDIVSEEFKLFIQNRNDLNAINNEIKKKKSFQLFEKFQFYVKKFLGKEFSYVQATIGTTINSVLHLNNQPFDINFLSPGQKTLFAYAILFFYLETNSKANINESIIIIDEPEKHLHPEAQIKLIDAIKGIIKDRGQLWIATHSIHILSHLEFDEILMVKDDGIILPSRTTPGKSFNDLMGLENHIDELSTFINSISEWSYAAFMNQCFKEPDVIFGNNTDDPQFKLFKEFLLDKSNINLLDYGAGKGRIGYTIMEDEEVSKRVIYSAFEPEKDNLEDIKAVPNIKEVFSEKSEISEEKFDCVLLCNVLHEITPELWVETFDNIKRVLKHDGFLIIVEDKFLPKGENANDYGYLILGTDETKKLLKSTEVLELKLSEKELSERILFNVFSKSQIEPNSNSVIEALELLNNNSFSNLKKIRKEMKSSNDVSIGRKYANQTQLHINSKLALEVLKSEKVKKATLEKL